MTADGDERVGSVGRAVDYNGCVPSASGRPSWRSRLVKPIVLVVVVAGLNTLGSYADRQAISPTDDARTTMLDYFRAAPGGEDRSDAWDRLRYVRGRLDNATSPTRSPSALPGPLSPERRSWNAPQ